ncbi:exonuclease domain-containing protein [Natronoflexus pectinivorans]|uniref:Exonuclease domain-containing protein n=1 Tax=Natronoflexus pectinivorans TaxID=682526 RepID=A0A4R2GFZ7_9BACT|nr:exonuclease domain-containing protein [Natronoflexus pectinivorans]TCO06973.1 hypothetical protein EV194_11193 [Natronoflexus pectinivorans]
MDINKPTPIEERYSGEFQDILFEGFGIKRFSEGHKYLGEFKNGEFNGKGALSAPKYGEEYEGEFKDGVYHGKGQLTLSTGAVYRGDFVDNEYHGQGVLSFSDGRRYEGQFVDSEFNGHGTLIFPDGKKYVGEFEDDEFNGNGVLSYPDGRIYKGEFRDGKPDGSGVLIHTDGYKYVGQFKKGLRYGSATIISPDGCRYVGEVTAGYYHGKGILRHPNGLEYIGEFAYNKYNGRGILSCPEGRVFDGFFLEGEFLKEGQNSSFESDREMDCDKNNETSRADITYLFFDAETTGLPKDYKASATDLNNWPRLVQLAYIVFNASGEKIDEGDFLVKPEGFLIPPEATKVHGITTEQAQMEGVDIATVLDKFRSLVEDADFLVAHNISYDQKVVGAEFLRHGYENVLSKKNQICTMNSTIEFCAIKNKYGYKWPSLSELYFKLFETGFSDVHNASADASATAKCFWELRRRNIL